LKEHFIYVTDHVKRHNKLKIKDLASKYGYNDSQFRNMRFGTQKVPVGLIDSIIEDFDINYNYKQIKNNANIVSEPKQEYKQVPLVKTEITATASSAMADVVTVKPDTFVNMPLLSRAEFVCVAQGNSMKGYINNGDYVAVRRIWNPDRIIYGECYVIITKESMQRTIKFVNENKDNKKLLWLSPYNVEQFQSQSIEKEDILEMYQVVGVVRSISS